MSEAHYNFGPGSYRIDQLQDEIVAAGLPTPAYLNGSGMTGPGTPATSVDVVYAAPLTPGQVNTLGATVAAHVPAGPRKSRPLWAIRGDLQGLTTTQWTATWNDLSAPVSGGPPRKYLGDYGVNAGTIFCYDHVIYVVGGTTAQVKAGQISLGACYVQDNPNYLVHPPWDFTINVPGDEPI